MKNLSIPIVSALLLAGLFACPNSATAQLYWDPTHTGGTGSGGAGTWSSAANWWNGSADVGWVANDTANFDGPSGTVTLGAAETVDGITFAATGYTITGSTLTLAGTPTITVPSGGTETISSIIAGSGIKLTESGSGALILSGANTYSGGTAISAGSTLQINSYNSAGTGTIAITGNGALTVLNGAASAADAVANTITGGTTSVINVEINSTTANLYFYPNLAGFTGTINVTSSVATPDSLVLEAAGPFSMVPPGTWNIGAGAEIYDADGLTITANIIINGPGNSSGYGAIRLQSGNITGNIQLAGTGANVNNNQIGNTAAGPFTLSGVISDAGGGQGLNIVGYPVAPATIILSGQNTYSGPTTLTSNTVRVASVENPGTSGPLGKSTAAGSILFPSGGTLQFSSVNQHDYSSRFSSAASQHYSIDLFGQNVTFASALTSPSGTLTLSNSTGTGTLTMTGANTYTGTTTLASGTLNCGSAEMGTSGPLGESGSIVFTGGTLQFSSVNQNDYSSRFSSAANQKYSIDVNGQSVSFASDLGSSGGTLTLKDTAGGGTLFINTADYYSGLTTVSSGTLDITGAGYLAGNIAVTGGKLEFDGAYTMNSASTLTLPNSPSSVVNLNFSGTLSLSGLYFGSALQAPGTWGAVGSGAANTSAAFTGSGILNVMGSPFYYWDQLGTDASSGSSANGVNGGGTGNWSASDWWAGASAGNPDVVWTANSIAAFEGTAGTVTLDASQSANGLAFTTSGYTIFEGAGSPVLTLLTEGSVTPFIEVLTGTATMGCPLAGSAGLSESGSGTLVLDGVNTYTGATTIGNPAVLTIGGAGQLTSGAYSGAISDGGAFIYNSSVAQTLSGVISGSGTLTQSGSGTLTLSGANTYTGGTTINTGGTVQITVPTGAGTGTIAINGGALTINTTAASSLALAVANTITGSSTGVINIDGQSSVNTFISSSPSGFTGTIYCTAGGSTTSVVVEAGGPMTLPAAATWNIASGATLDLNAGGTEAASVVLNGPGASANYGALRLDNANVSGNILLAGTGNNNQIGNAGTSTTSTISGVISDGGLGYGLNRVGYPPVINTIVLSGENTYGGVTTLTSNTLGVASTENPGTSGPLGNPLTPANSIVFTGGILQFSSANQYDYSSRFSSAASQKESIDVNGQSVTFASPLTSSGGTLVLTDTAGGGTLTLSGANTYTGTTTISNGTLNVSGSIADNVTVIGGTLKLSSSTAMASTANLTLPASSSGTVNLNFSGTQSINGLIFGASVAAPGTWGAVGSGAANQNAAFTGSGILNVTTGIYPLADWDPNGNDASPGSGGTGSWDSSTSDWWVSGSVDTMWPANDIANFAGTAGTVTLNASEAAVGLTFATSGYTIAEGSGSPTLALGSVAITIPNAGTETINCILTGTTGLTEGLAGGSGTLILGATNTYAGGTTIPVGGALEITAPAGASTGTITDNGTLTVNTTTANTLGLAVAAAITGNAGSVINIDGQNSVNTFISSSLSGFTGTIYCTAGGSTVSAVVEAAGPLSLPAAATWNIASGATLDFNAGGTEAASVVINGPGAAANYGALRLDGSSASGNILLAGAGNNNQIGGTHNNTTNTISGVISDGGAGNGLNRVGYPPAVASVIALSGQNTYSGPTTLTSNILQVASTEHAGTSGPLGKSAASNPGSIIFVSGTLQYSSANNNDYSGRFSTAASQAYSIDVNGQSVTFATPLTSSGGTLTLSDTAGGGTLTLSGASTYNGGTTVNSGTLDINAAGSVQGNVTVNAGTLELDSATAMASTASLSAGYGVSVNLTYGGTQNINALFVGGVQQAPGIYGASAYNPGVFIGSGTLTVSSGPPVTISAPTLNADGSLTICWASVSGGNYNVVTSTSVAPSATWTAVNASPIPSQGSTTCYTLPANIFVGQPQIFISVQQ